MAGLPFDLALTLRRGTVYKMAHRHLTSGLPHFMVVLNLSPKTDTVLVLGVFSSQIGDVPEAFIREIFYTMAETPWHTYQILTKRAERMAEMAPRLNWTPNVWMGVTVENGDHIDRIDYLRSVPSTVRFLSLEPLLGALWPLGRAGGMSA